MKNSISSIWCYKYGMSISQINIDTNICINMIGDSKKCLQSCKLAKNCVKKISSIK